MLVLSLWGASEVGEVVRGALHSLPRGQREAGLSIGLDGPQLYGYVLLPQALKRMTPPTINVYTRIIKTSSLAVLIGVVDVIKVGQQIIERTYESVLIYGALFLFFSFFHLLPAVSRLACAGAALDASMSALIEFKGFNKFFSASSRCSTALI